MDIQHRSRPISSGASVRIEEQIQQLRNEATEHKRLAQQHRRAARRTLDKLRAICEKYGIDFVVNERDIVE